MKKIILARILIIFAVLFLSSSAFAVETNSKTVRVGVYDNSPKIYKDANGDIKGLWADITNYIAQKENWNLIYVYGTWEEGLARLENGEIDLMVDVAVSDARKEKYDFNNESTLLSWSIIYTRKDFDIKSFKDLEGKNIAIMKSSVHYTAPLGLKNVLTSFGVTANIIDVKSMDDVFKLLDTNEADAGVVNWNFGVTNESKYKITRTGIIFNPSELNYALPKNGVKNSYLINVLDYHLRELKNNPNSIYYQSINTNFAKSLGAVEVLPKWLNTFLIVACVLLIIIAAVFLLMRQYQKTLRREINKGIHDIKESEEKYSAVVNQAQDGIVIVQDQVIKYANKAIGIIGYGDKEVLGMPFIKMIAPDEQKKVAESYKKRVAGEKVEAIYETKLAHKDGTIIDVEFSSGVIAFAGKPAVLVMVRDITGRKKLENEIKFRNTILSTELEVAIDGVLVVGEKGGIILHNQKFVEMWGIPKEVIALRSDDLTLKSVLDKLSNPEEFSSRVKCLYSHPTEIDRTEIILKDGRIFDRYSAPMIDSAQKNYGRVWYFRDISEAKKFEIRLKELDTLKSKFIEIVAHQLNTPLNVIRWSLESLLSGTQFKLEEAAKGAVYNSLNADVEVINRIDDLLKALDIEEGRLVHLNKKPISPESLCESIMIEAKKRCAVKKIDCSYEHPKDPLPVVEVDNDKIRAIFEKLVDNAIFYTKENGKISVSLRQIRDKIRFEVTDNGIGIPKSEQKNIFSRFYRATNATPMRPDASGLGLFIAKYFAEQHGGKISFESEEGKGTNFWFDLPLTNISKIK